jgi:hypothetical protein
MEAFLSEFGMFCTERTDDTLHMRGLDEDPFVHVTHRSAPGFLAAGFAAASMKDLEALAREEKVWIDRLDGPGGGSLVRLTDPNGFHVEVVAGPTLVPQIELSAPRRPSFLNEHGRAVGVSTKSRR